MSMSLQLVKAARMHAEGEFERAKTNIMVYMNQSVGIGEHSDIVEAIQKELDTMALASDRIEMLKKHFEPSISARQLLSEDGQDELDLGDAGGC